MEQLRHWKGRKVDGTWAFRPRFGRVTRLSIGLTMPAKTWKESLDREKFTAAVLHLLWGCRQNPPGLVALVKLVWYADYWHYQEHLHTITGAKYLAMPEGPVMDNYRDLFNGLQLGGYVEVEPIPIQDQHYPKQQFRALVAPREGLLSDEEVRTIGRVSDRLGGMTGRALSQKSHQEPPWIYAWDKDSPNNPIPYVLFRWSANLPTEEDADIVRRIAIERAEHIAAARRHIASLAE